MPKGKRLVLEHLEEVSFRVLEEYPSVVRDMIRGRPGIYALYRRDKLYYVGLASNLMGRLKQHIRDRHRGSWDRFSVYVTVRSDHMKELESLLLRIVDPVGNKTGGKFVRSQNLLWILSRMMRDEDADRRAILLGERAARRRRRQKARGRKSTEVLPGLIDRRRALKGWYKDWEYRATLRKNGTISYGREVFDNPNAAARAAVGRRRNGWRFWHYKDPRGEWVPIERLL